MYSIVTGLHGDAVVLRAGRAIAKVFREAPEFETNLRLIHSAPEAHALLPEAIKLIENLFSFTRKIGDLETRDRCADWLTRAKILVE